MYNVAALQLFNPLIFIIDTIWLSSKKERKKESQHGQKICPSYNHMVIARPQHVAVAIFRLWTYEIAAVARPYGASSFAMTAFWWGTPPPDTARP